MKKESNTEFLARRPVLRAVLNMLAKKIEAAIVIVILLVWQQHHTKIQIWGETGDHFQDLVKQTQMLEMEVNGEIETNNIGK